MCFNNGKYNYLYFILDLFCDYILHIKVVDFGSIDVLLCTLTTRDW